MINVGAVIRSGRLSQAITVERTTALWERGEFIRGAPEIYTLRGIITQAQPRDLQMVPEGDRVTGAISVLTNSVLYVTRADNVSDVVIWHGNRYRVVNVKEDVDYGFFRSLCSRLDGEDFG